MTSDTDTMPALPEPVSHKTFRQSLTGEPGVRIPLFTDEQMRAYGRQCAEQERERCSKVCDAIAASDGTGYGIADDCAAAIRSQNLIKE